MSEHRPDTGAVESGHEPSGDLDVRKTAAIAGGFLLFFALILFATTELFNFLNREEAPAEPLSPFAGRRQVPPAPRLQPSPERDLQRLREDNARLLSGYDWVDQKAGTVRIPIDRAMELLVQRGLPVEGQSAAAASQTAAPAQARKAPSR